MADWKGVMTSKGPQAGLESLCLGAWSGSGGNRHPAAPSPPVGVIRVDVDGDRGLPVQVGTQRLEVDRAFATSGSGFALPDAAHVLRLTDSATPGIDVDFAEDGGGLGLRRRLVGRRLGRGGVASGRAVVRGGRLGRRRFGGRLGSRGCLVVGRVVVLRLARVVGSEQAGDFPDTPAAAEEQEYGRHAHQGDP